MGLANIVNAMERLDVLNFPYLRHTLQLAVKQSFDIHAVSKMLAGTCAKTDETLSQVF